MYLLNCVAKYKKIEEKVLVYNIMKLMIGDDKVEWNGLSEKEKDSVEKDVQVLVRKFNKVMDRG